MWVTDFPLFDYDEEQRRHVAVHHPFTAPHDEDLARLEAEPLAIRAQAYDLVLNGTELGGGSVRIHQPAVQERVFALLGISAEEAQAQVRIPARSAWPPARRRTAVSRSDSIGS